MTTGTSVQYSELQDLVDDAAMMGVSLDRLRQILLREQQQAQGIIRISSLPAVFSCSSSLLAVEHPYDPSSEMASIGTAAHEALATVVAGDVPDVDAVAKKHRVDADELAPLVAIGQGAWHELELDRQHARPEYRLNGRGIAGTTDVAYHDAVRGVVVDWKTNRVKRVYWPQLVGYASALADEFVFPESGRIEVVTVWLRFGEFETTRVTQDDINRFYDDLEAIKLDVGQRYTPGNACTYCPRQLVCEARHDYLRSAAQAISAAQHVQVDPVILSSLYHQSKALRKALDQYDSALRMALREGRALPDGEGNLLELGYLERDKIDPVKAWPIVEEYDVSDDDIAQCITMSKTKLHRVVGKDLNRGHKGKVRSNFWREMRERGAVKQTISETIKVVGAE